MNNNLKQNNQLNGDKRHGQRGRGRSRNTWKIDLEREMWTAGFRFSRSKTEMAAQDRAG